MDFQVCFYDELAFRSMMYVTDTIDSSHFVLRNEDLLTNVFTEKNSSFFRVLVDSHAVFCLGFKNFYQTFFFFHIRKKNLQSKSWKIILWHVTSWHSHTNLTRDALTHRWRTKNVAYRWDDNERSTFVRTTHFLTLA